MIIDTHIHLNLKQINKNLQQVLQKSRDAGVKKFIIPAIDSSKMGDIIALAEKEKDIFFAAGHHPNNTYTADMDKIRAAAAHEKCVAIGECGLDWYRIPPGASIHNVQNFQKDMFRKQLALAQELDKPVILHSRETDDDMLEVLSEFSVKAVIHCYIGGEKHLSLIDKGFYYGIGGVFTYSNSEEFKKNIKKIPVTQLLLETDGPFLLPAPAKKKFGRVVNTSEYLPYVSSEIAKTLNVDQKELEKVLFENSIRLFPQLAN